MNLKETFEFLFKNVADKATADNVGKLLELPQSGHVVHYIDRDGFVKLYDIPPVDLLMNTPNVDSLVDYLVSIGGQPADDSEAPKKTQLTTLPASTTPAGRRCWDINDVDVLVGGGGVNAFLDRETNRDKLYVELTKTAAFKTLSAVSKQEDSDRAIGSRMRQADLVRLFDLDLRGHVEPDAVRPFESVRWSGSETEVGTAMRDKTSLGREIDSLASAFVGGTDAQKLPDYVDVVLPVYNDPIFVSSDRWSTVRLFIIPDMVHKTFELVVRPDELHEAKCRAVHHVVTFIRDHITTRIGETGIRIVGG